MRDAGSTGTAWISGQGRQAVIETAGRFYLLPYGEGERGPVPCSGRFLAVHKSLYRSDLLAVPAGRPPFVGVARELRAAVQRDRLRAYALGLLDAAVAGELVDEAAALRRELALGLEKLLADAELQAAWHDLFGAAPLPADADVAGALAAAAPVAPRAAALLRELGARQPAVRKAWALWQEWADADLGEPQVQERVRAWFIGCGGPAALVTAVHDGDCQALVAFCLRGARAAPPELGGQPLRLLNRLLDRVEPAAGAAQRQRAAASGGAAGVDGLAGAQGAADGADGPATASPVGAPGSAARALHGPRQAQQRIEAQEQAILQALQIQRLDRASSLVQDLIRDQLRSGDSRSLASSLSELAAHAHRLGRLGFAAYLGRLAREHTPED
ncbi:MAG: hypothetical protein U1A78_11990 [Polyangia bacterium]